MRQPHLPRPHHPLPPEASKNARTADAAGPAQPGRRHLLGAALAAAFGSMGLAACGGGGEDPPAPADEVKMPLGGVDGGGTGSPAMMFLSAAVQATSPLTVGGVQLDTSGSQIADADDQAVAAGQLLPGMQCRVEAGRLQHNTTPPQAIAQRVTVAEALCGPVANIDQAVGQFILLGQTVAVTSSTVWGPGLAGGALADLAALTPGAVLQVHGQLDTSANRTVATRIDLAPATSRWVLRGSLSALDRALGTAAVGAQSLQFSAALAATLDAGLAAGSVVRAVVQAGDVSGPLQLLALRGDALQLPERVQAQIEGRITRIDSASRLAIDGVTVEVATPVAHANWLVLGARAEAQGRAVNGVLLASTVTVEPDEPVELEGSITLASASRQTFLLKGVVVAWTPTTTWAGGTARQLTARRKVAVKGRWNAGRSVLEALQIHIEA